MSPNSTFTHNIFFAANDFANSSEFLRSCIEKYNEWDLCVPSVLNAVISVELYFKCIYALEKINDIGINNIEMAFKRYRHNISDLFADLDIETQKAIENDFDCYIKTERMLNQKSCFERVLGKSFDYNFNASLVENCLAFENLRYVFDQDSWGNVTGTEALRMAVISQIKKNKPEWYEDQNPVIFPYILSKNTAVKNAHFDSSNIFMHADRFAKAVYFMSEHRPPIPFAFCIFVNSALVLELYLKCLLHIETNNFLHTHSLTKLFTSLSAESKKQIILFYDDFIKSNGQHLKQIEALEAAMQSKIDNRLEITLNDMSFAFINLRYAYEKKFKSFVGYMPIKMSLLSQIKKVKPEYFINR